MLSVQKKLQNKRSQTFQAPYALILSLARTVSGVFHRYPNYPTLPEKTPKENSLPLQIGSKVLEEAYNNFLEHNTSKGYKFHWDNGNVYIVGMSKCEHESIVLRLIMYFKVPNGGVDDDPPIDITLQTFHRNPSHIKTKIAADIAICPDIALVQDPLLPGPPPGDDYPHARIIVEVAVLESTAFWNKKCETWLLEQYVRCVFGIKIHEQRRGSRRRSMTAKLWTRQFPPPAGSTNSNLAGVYVLEWDFGTAQLNGKKPTGCTAPGIANYTVTIPVSDVFWDPPVNAGVLDLARYTVAVPGGVTANNFVIDLYRLQQIVLKKQVQ
ncbi:5028_t:CDS:2 [Paraglomus brasilianum]|uniref:5028_t:CDS:1 n=1 Tax=Paraglomus brasilianum TaxID=144538 RepID=A0A9N9GIS0_9GLOM|nr:5028_t:CDS:2 [Paraglomus brasilianum]